MGIKDLNNTVKSVLVFVYMLALLVSGIMPDNKEFQGPAGVISPAAWNFLHIPAYGFLALLWIWVLKGRGASQRKRKWLGLAIPVFFGAIIEVFQAWVPGRFPSFLDLGLNLAGIFLFVMVYQKVFAENEPD